MLRRIAEERGATLRLHREGLEAVDVAATSVVADEEASETKLKNSSSEFSLQCFFEFNEITYLTNRYFYSRGVVNFQDLQHLGQRL